jgi:alpha-tubulin suppressor-like RCC1 family protein
MRRLPGAFAACVSLALVPVASAATVHHPYAGYQWGDPDAKGNRVGPQPTPTTVSGIPNQVSQIATSNSDDYALDSTGKVWAWGAASQGELGAGHKEKTRFIATPTQVQFPAGVTITKLANPGPYDTMMAIDSHGNVWGWGDDRDHELCVNQTVINTPVELPLSDVTLATGAGDHALYDAGGTLEGCGGNASGDLGDGSTNPSSTPEPVTGLPHQPITAITSSYHDSGALLAGGAYYDWGLGSGGQLGDGATVNSDVPVEVPLGSPAAQVSAGGSLSSNGQSIALLTNGRVLSWGVNTDGQLGNGTTKSSSTPTPVSVPAGVKFDYVNSGGGAEYAIDSTGDAWSWGSNQSGQLGLNTVDENAHPDPTSLGVDMSRIWSTAANVYGY